MNLEKFIKEHKADFDTEIPSEKVWNSIASKLNKKHKQFVWKPYVAAASVMLFLASTWLLADIKLSNKAVNEDDLISAELQQAQIQFSSLIELKRNELNRYRKDNPELISDFEHQLVELQANYHQLLPQLKDEKKRDIVLQAVIENLQIQVDILNQQLEIIKQYKEPKNDTEEIVPL